MGPYRLDPQSLRLRANPGSPIGALVGIFDSGTPAHAGMNRRLRAPAHAGMNRAAPRSRAVVHPRMRG